MLARQEKLAMVKARAIPNGTDELEKDFYFLMSYILVC
jgi:hypothetical protein